MEKLHYICGRTANRPVTYRNNISGNFWNNICTTKPLEIKPISSNKTFNVKIDESVFGNAISAYNQAHSGNGEL